MTARHPIGPALLLALGLLTGMSAVSTGGNPNRILVRLDWFSGRGHRDRAIADRLRELLAASDEDTYQATVVAVQPWRQCGPGAPLDRVLSPWSVLGRPPPCFVGRPSAMWT